MSHLVYKLTPNEYDRYRKHLLALDEYSKYLRFGFHISDEVINTLCTKFASEASNHKIFVIENNDLDVVGAGHVSLEGNTVELAFSVLKDYQKQGMGDSLMKRCIEWCQNRGLDAGCMVCLSTNIAIKKLAGKHGVLINDGGETLVNIKIPSANSTSMLNEVIDSNLARLDHLGKLQQNFVRKVLHFR
jgi:GNAT superfamily N-acetyltransferase